MVIECAPAACCARSCSPLSQPAKPRVVLSAGALLEQWDLVEVARKSGGQIVVPTGALIGLDAVTAAAEGVIHSVRMVTRKPVAGLVGAPYLVKNGIDIAGLRERAKCSTAPPARGPGASPPTSMSPPRCRSPASVPTARCSRFGPTPRSTATPTASTSRPTRPSFTMSIANVPSENPKTGRITALSVIAALRKMTRRCGWGLRTNAPCGCRRPAHVLPSDPLRPRRFARRQRRLDLAPGGRIRAEQHDAADHRGQRPEELLGDRDQQDERERDPDRTRADHQLGGERQLAAARDRLTQLLDALFDARNILAGKLVHCVTVARMRERTKLGFLVNAPCEADRNLDDHVGDGRDRDREVELQTEPLLQAEQHGGADQHGNERGRCAVCSCPGCVTWTWKRWCRRCRAYWPRGRS